MYCNQTIHNQQDVYTIKDLLKISSGIWVTKDGKKIPIRNMELSHIINTIRLFVEKNRFDEKNVERMSMVKGVIKEFHIRNTNQHAVNQALIDLFLKKCKDFNV